MCCILNFFFTPRRRTTTGEGVFTFMTQDGQLIYDKVHRYTQDMVAVSLRMCSLRCIWTSYLWCKMFYLPKIESRNQSEMVLCVQSAWAAVGKSGQYAEPPFSYKIRCRDFYTICFIEWKLLHPFCSLFYMELCPLCSICKLAALKTSIISEQPCKMQNEIMSTCAWALLQFCI